MKNLVCGVGSDIVDPISAAANERYHFNLIPGTQYKISVSRPRDDIKIHFYSNSPRWHFKLLEQRGNRQLVCHIARDPVHHNFQRSTSRR